VPVQKFRSIQEMNAARVLTSADEAFDRFLRHRARYRAIAPGVYPRGVFKFRTLEEAQEARRREQRSSARAGSPPDEKSLSSACSAGARGEAFGSEAAALIAHTMCATHFADPGGAGCGLATSHATPRSGSKTAKATA